MKTCMDRESRQDEDSQLESTRKIKEKTSEIMAMSGKGKNGGMGDRNTERKSEAESKWRRASVKHSCLPLVLALR